MSPPREPDDDWRLDDPLDTPFEARVDGSGSGAEHARSATFDELIEGWRREGSVPAWPDAPKPTVTDAAAASRPAAEPDEPPVARDTEIDPAIADDAEDEHYVPPEPPPLPRLGAPAVVGLGLLGLGLLLLVAPWWIGVSETFAIPLGLLALASGLGWLVLRLWPPPPGEGDADGTGDGDDDGAVI